MSARSRRSASGRGCLRIPGPNLRSGIQPEGKAFTLHNVSGQPQQTQEMKDGKRYLVVTWFGGISATKAGKYPASLSVNATVAVRDTAAPSSRAAGWAGPSTIRFSTASSTR